MATLYTNPIYKDTYYTTTAATANYRIELEGGNIFSGKAVRYPGADELQININKICRNYLDSDIRGLLGDFSSSLGLEVNTQAQRTFKLYVNGTNVADYRFYQDYSYEENGRAVTGLSINVSNPINNHYVPGMIAVRTFRTGTNDISTVYTQGQTEPGLGYTQQVKCTPYVLYYLNSYGGWDAFVIEGTAFKRDAITSYQTDRVFNNNTLDFETNKYVNEIKTNYEFNTHYLSDAEAKNLAKNLIGSTKVYLQNIDEGWVKPVVITDSEAQYQTYQTNGRKLCQYRIKVVESQSKIRK